MLPGSYPARFLIAAIQGAADPGTGVSEGFSCGLFPLCGRLREENGRVLA